MPYIDIRSRVDLSDMKALARFPYIRPSRNDKNSNNNSSKGNASTSLSASEVLTVKRNLITFLRNFGLPGGFFTASVNISFSKKTYVLDLPELEALELFRHQDHEHDEDGGYPTPHILHMCVNPLTALAYCKESNSWTLLELKHRLATVTLKAYYELYEQYILKMNELVSAIFEVEIKNYSDVEKIVRWLYSNHTCIKMN